MKTFKCICIFLLIALFNVSCDQSKPERTKVKTSTPKKEQVKVPKQQKTETSKVKAPAQQKTEPSKVKVPTQQKTEPSKVKVPAPQKTESSKVDKFGRTPDHPHYGHNHTVGGHSKETVDSTLIPADGKADKFGRPPGHPHYGHNHR